LATGIFAMGVSWAICRGRETTIYGGSIVVPAPTLIPDGFLESEEVRFDLPISVWSQDRLNRGEFIKSVAVAVVEHHAPAVAITGPFGEGKTSAMGLLETTLASRSDLVIAKFSSWLPGDEQTLALTLFGTIAEQIKTRFLIPGLSRELTRFARLLVGSVPKIGGFLESLLDEPSQVERPSFRSSWMRGVTWLIVRRSATQSPCWYAACRNLEGSVKLPIVFC
jgi:KAP-like P-loop domain-containing protein